jgi:hypothetical protein
MYAPAAKKCCRLRFYCKRRYYTNNCQFMLLAMKTSSNAYHVYKHGEHVENGHQIVKPLSKIMRKFLLLKKYLDFNFNSSNTKNY